MCDLFTVSYILLHVHVFVGWKHKLSNSYPWSKNVHTVDTDLINFVVDWKMDKKKKKDRLLVPGDEDENGISNPMMVFIVLIHQLFQNESSWFIISIVIFYYYSDT